jgi:hypothetical protein
VTSLSYASEGVVDTITASPVGVTAKTEVCRKCFNERDYKNSNLTYHKSLQERKTTSLDHVGRLCHEPFVVHCVWPQHMALHSTRHLYAAVCTTVKPCPSVFAISSSLCCSKPSAYATSFHCLSLSHLANLAASFCERFFACLSYDVLSANDTEHATISENVPSR